MLNILAVHPPYPGDSAIKYMPLGFGLVLGIAKREHRVTLLDLLNDRASWADVERALEQGDYDVCMMGGFAMQVEAMREVGIDISAQRSKHLDEFAGKEFDYVVTVCDRARESCPIFPGARQVLHWSFDDPAVAQGAPDERKSVFRRVRDEIAGRINQTIGEAPSSDRSHQDS